METLGIQVKVIGVEIVTSGKECRKDDGRCKPGSHKIKKDLCNR